MQVGVFHFLRSVRKSKALSLVMGGEGRLTIRTHLYAVSPQIETQEFTSRGEQRRWDTGQDQRCTGPTSHDRHWNVQGRIQDKVVVSTLSLHKALVLLSFTVFKLRKIRKPTAGVMTVGLEGTTLSSGIQLG
ncbi:unnamed protein product [Pylaiella littoralis]